MADVDILNTDAELTGSLLIDADDAQTIEGLKTFNRAPNAPFAVETGSAVVLNLDADKVDGIEGANLARWDGLGTPGGKIKFPAVQSASADPNTLDDYEEGTFTPALTFGGASTGITYSVQSGTYTKVGNMVFAEARIALTSKGSATGGASIAGLPFSAVGVAVSSPIDFNTAGASITTTPFAVLSGTTLVLAQANGTTGTRAFLTDANFTNTTDIRVTAVYRV